MVQQVSGLFNMTIATSAITTVGNITQWLYGTTSTNSWNQSTCYWPLYPIFCTDDIHVFACEHAEFCKCGKAARAPEPKKCGICGK